MVLDARRVGVFWAAVCLRARSEQRHITCAYPLLLLRMGFLGFWVFGVFCGFGFALLFTPMNKTRAMQLEFPIEINPA